MSMTVWGLGVPFDDPMWDLIRVRESRAIRGLNRVEEDEEAEDRRQLEELTRLRKMVARKRRQEEIERLRRELSSGNPDVSM